MSRRVKILTVVLMAVLAGGALYLRVLARRMAYHPPSRHAADVARTRLSEAALQPTSPRETATLYFPSLEQGTLVEEKRPISWATSDADRIKQVILALVEGSRQGLSRALPPATSIRAVFLTSDGTAYLDLSEQTAAELRPGIANECLVLDSMVNSIGVNIPAVKKVKILIQGQPVDTLDGHADLSDLLVPDLTRLGTNP
jgi:spore germination protein GerM